MTDAARPIVLKTFSLAGRIRAITFAPDGYTIALVGTHGLQLWKIPTVEESISSSQPFVLLRSLARQSLELQTLSWSHTGSHIIGTGSDMAVHVWSLTEEHKPASMVGHRDVIRGAWFVEGTVKVRLPIRVSICAASHSQIYSVSADGCVIEWIRDDGADDETALVSRQASVHHRWKFSRKAYACSAPAKLQSACFTPTAELLGLGISTGVVSIFDIKSFSTVQTVSISSAAIDQISFSSTGDWLAIGIEKLNQLLVWEWQSESFICKQQAHLKEVTAVCHTTDTDHIVTGSLDGTMKIWSVSSGFCVATMSDHSRAITALCSAVEKKHIVFSSSEDGSVRAWDVKRLRNFRVFTGPDKVQYTCVCCTVFADVVAAGTRDNYEIHVWNVQNSQLLRNLARHEAPISALQFSEQSDLLISGSWDKTIHTWSIFTRDMADEAIDIGSDVQSICVNPDGTQLCVSTLDGSIHVRHLIEGKSPFVIDGRRDLTLTEQRPTRADGMRLITEQHFTCMRYTADGECIVAGSNTGVICLYNVETHCLLRRWRTSQRNHEVSGPQGYVPITSLSMATTGTNFAAAVADRGVLVYTQGASVLSDTPFDPHDLQLEITPTNTLRMLQEGNVGTALDFALRLNEMDLTVQVYENIPREAIPIAIQNLSLAHMKRFMKFLATYSAKSPHLEYHLTWITCMLNVHGRTILDQSDELAAELRSLRKFVGTVQSSLVRLSEGNLHTQRYLVSCAALNKKNDEIDVS